MDFETPPWHLIFHPLTSPFARPLFRPPKLMLNKRWSIFGCLLVEIEIRSREYCKLSKAGPMTRGEGASGGTSEDYAFAAEGQRKSAARRNHARTHYARTKIRMTQKWYLGPGPTYWGPRSHLGPWPTYMGPGPTYLDTMLSLNWAAVSALGAFVVGNCRKFDRDPMGPWIEWD